MMVKGKEHATTMFTCAVFVSEDHSDEDWV
jgi:hypothetical protein